MVKCVENWKAKRKEEQANLEWLDLEIEKVRNQMAGLDPTTEAYKSAMERYDKLIKYREDLQWKFDWKVFIQCCGIIVAFLGTVVVPVTLALFAYHKEEEYQLPNARVMGMAEKAMAKPGMQHIMGNTDPMNVNVTVNPVITPDEKK